MHMLGHFVLTVSWRDSWLSKPEVLTDYLWAGSAHPTAHARWAVGGSGGKLLVYHPIADVPAHLQTFPAIQRPTLGTKHAGVLTKHMLCVPCFF